MDKQMIAYLHKKGYTNVDFTMQENIRVWESWYAGKVDGFHDYTIWNGNSRVRCEMASLQLAKTVSEQLANLLFNERCKIIIDHDATQDFIRSVFDDNNFWVKINESQEKKAASGTVCYIPYVLSIGRNTPAKRVYMNYVSAEHLYPLSWSNGVIEELCVTNKNAVSGSAFLLLQLFTKDSGGNYIIQNSMLKEKENGTYEEVSLASVPGFETMSPVFHTKSSMKPFVIDRLNIANNINWESPMGLSVFANAIDAMKFCDTVYDSYRNEFILGKKRVMVSTGAVNLHDGSPVFDPRDVVFYQIPPGIDNDDMIKELNMTLRIDEHQKALQQGLNLFSSQCGLGENFYRYNEGSVATATQIISENNTLFRTLKKHEIVLDAVLVDLVRLLIHMGRNLLGRTDLKEDAEVTIQFDDSIIEDKNADIQRWQWEVSAGVLKPEIYLANRYGVTEEAAREMMPEMTQVIE